MTDQQTRHCGVSDVDNQTFAYARFAMSRGRNHIPVEGDPAPERALQETG